MLNYFRYILAIGLFSLVFFNQTITIDEDMITSTIDKQFPKTIDKKGFIIVLNNLTINSVENNVIDSTVVGNIKMNDKNIAKKLLENDKATGFFSKIFKKTPSDFLNKKVDFTINSKITPILNGSNLSFKIESLEVENVINMKKVKGYLKKFIENIEIPIKKLEKYSFLIEAKKIAFTDTGDLKVTVKIKTWLILLLLPFLLLREIGLFLIFLYQKFISPRKGFKCAKGELHGNGTCSSSTKKAFKEKGFIAGMKEYRKSTLECREAYNELKGRKKSSDCKEVSLCAGCDASSLAFAGGEGTECGLSACDVSACDVSACDVSACDVSACDVGACDVGACDVGACDVGAC